MARVAVTIRFRPVVGVSSLAAGHLALAPALKRSLAEVGLGDAMIVVGGVIPEQDFKPLREAGVDAIFPPGTVIVEAAISLLEQLNQRMGGLAGGSGVEAAQAVVISPF